MGYIRLEKDADGILELIMDQPGEAVNTMGDEFIEAMTKAVDEIEAQKDVNMAAAGFGVEQASRNADFEREKAWKETKLIKDNAARWTSTYSRKINKALE